MAEGKELADLYVQTLISIEEDGKHIPVERAQWSQETIHVITAWNPNTERLVQEENDKANERLHQNLVDRGLSPCRAVGKDPNSDYFEDSWAVIGLSDQEARDIGTSFNQVAVFRVSDGEQTVIACTEDWCVSRLL
jgi:hypothetical protein